MITFSEAENDFKLKISKLYSSNFENNPSELLEIEQVILILSECFLFIRKLLRFLFWSQIEFLIHGKHRNVSKPSNISRYQNTKITQKNLLSKIYDWCLI